MTAPKKEDTPFARLHGYLNYGLLSLATRLEASGYSPRLFHGDFSDPAEFVAGLVARGLVPTAHPILLSLPSSFSLPWARAAVRSLKQIDPSLHIVVGGRWVVATDGEWIRNQIPDADLVVYGLAEQRVVSLMDAAIWPHVPYTDRTPGADEIQHTIPELNFELVENYKRFQPCVEVSRGCGMGCNFCAEKDTGLGALRPPTEVAAALHELTRLYAGQVTPYFQASFFNPTQAWADNLAQEFARSGVSLQWRAETRVDCITTDQIGALARAGLKVLDLGLESASPQQVQRMNKSQKPGAYLRRASDVLRACHDNGVWAKVNVLWFPGETARSIEETRSWLRERKSQIKGVSAGPMIVYRYGPESDRYLAEMGAFGARPTEQTSLEERGFARLHLSPQLSQDAAVALSKEVSREMMNADDYYDLKSFSYFPRDFSRSDFLTLAAAAGEGELPFRSGVA